MPGIDGHACFFCDSNPATRTYRPPPGLSWPEPMDPKSVLVMCDDCAGLPAAEIARHLAEYVNTLRVAHNAEVLARRAATN
jgi:hypothetical protein